MEHRRPSIPQVFVNELYNRWFLRHVRRSIPEGSSDAQLKKLPSPDSNPYQLVWLRNLKRIVNEVRRRHPLEALTFLDVGCGEGLPTIYVAERFSLGAAEGFDFDEDLLTAAKLLLDQSSELRCPVHYFNADARNLVLPANRYLLFLFNPFGLSTTRRFFSNNREMLEANESFIGLANDHVLEEILDALPRAQLIWRHHRTNCSLIRTASISLQATN